MKDKTPACYYESSGPSLFSPTSLLSKPSLFHCSWKLCIQVTCGLQGFSEIGVLEHRGSLTKGTMQLFPSDIFHCHRPRDGPHSSFTHLWFLGWGQGFLSSLSPTVSFKVMRHKILPHPLQWAKTLRKVSKTWALKSAYASRPMGGAHEGLTTFVDQVREKYNKGMKMSLLIKFPATRVWFVSTSREKLPALSEDTLIFHT